LIGSDDRSRDQIKELLSRFRHDIIRTHEMSMAEKRSAVQEFHLTTIRGNIRIRSLEARERARLHAKVYIFDATPPLSPLPTSPAAVFPRMSRLAP
jgi:hypothetical protein